MSANGLDVFDKTLQTTHIWLNEIMEEIGEERHVAWHVLGGVLRTIRDRIPIELASHLGAELPLLIRGAYYDQWRPSVQPERYRSLDEFLDQVATNISGTRPVAPRHAASAVFAVLSRHVPEGQIRKVREALPHEIQMAWQESAPPEDRHRVEMEVDQGRISREA